MSRFACGIEQAAKHLLRRFFNEMQSGQRKCDEGYVADPGIEPGDAEVIEDMGVVNQVPEVEVEQVEAIT